MKSKTKALTATTTKTTTIQSEFWFAIARTAVSQICQSVGFKAAELSALETLTLVATKYLQTIAHSAASFANHSSRIQSNLLDLTHALHGVVSLHSGGFPGGSILHKDSSNVLLASGVLKDLSRFVEFRDEIPFAKPIPRRNFTTPEISIPASRKSDHSHVPKWLPEFPEANSKKRAREEKLWEEDLDNSNGKRVAVKERKKTELLGVVGRGRVRFRIGGKKTCWNNGNGNNDGVDDKSKGIEDEDDKNCGFKRRRR